MELPVINHVKEGDHIIIFLNKRKNWLVKAEKDKSFHTHRGLLNLNSIIGLEYGSSISTSLNERMWILKPTMYDFILKSRRLTQIVYPKDLGIIAAWTGLSSGKVVVESGTGSGALTIFAANLVRPTGHVYSFEIRPEFLKIAEKNIALAGLQSIITLKIADAKAGLGITGADIALVDVGDPWTLVKPMWNALNGGGILAAISPTINQVEKLTNELLDCNFIDTETLEIIVRNIEARSGKTRPAMRMIGHTAYLTFARKALRTDKD
tara:strand:- start:1191 stop:1988 length:798 start_codon:yes stop_codon:yes gene_type:complete